MRQVHRRGISRGLVLHVSIPSSVIPAKAKNPEFSKSSGFQIAASPLLE
jgi:hypothetical protein